MVSALLQILSDLSVNILNTLFLTKAGDRMNLKRFEPALSAEKCIGNGSYNNSPLHYCLAYNLDYPTS